MDGHAVEGLSLADDADDYVGVFGRGLEQAPALEGAGGDFDKGMFGDEAQRAWHTGLLARVGRSCFCFL
jgi:hypothetical protein